MTTHVLDPREFGVALRIVDFLLGPLKHDPVLLLDPPQKFPPDLDQTGGLRAQIDGELANAPPR
jgi:hypothetical protein